MVRKIATLRARKHCQWASSTYKNSSLSANFLRYVGSFDLRLSTAVSEPHAFPSYQPLYCNAADQLSLPPSWILPEQMLISWAGHIRWHVSLSCQVRRRRGASAMGALLQPRSSEATSVQQDCVSHDNSTAASSYSAYLACTRQTFTDTIRY